MTNLVNQKIYIGKTTRSNPIKRFENHLYWSNYNPTCYFHNALRKYGKENFIFEVIFNTFIEEDLNYFECYFIKEYNSSILDDNSWGYNMTRGGDGFNSETAKAATQSHKEDYVNPGAGAKGSEMSTLKNLERSKLGTNPWGGVQGSERAKIRTKALLEDGTHPFLDREAARIRANKQSKDGTHPFQVFNSLKWVCPYYATIGIGKGNANRWHFDKCKSK